MNEIRFLPNFEPFSDRRTTVLLLELCKLYRNLHKLVGHTEDALFHHFGLIEHTL